MALLLQPQSLADMVTHAATTYPEECCGLLLGIQNVRQRDRTVHELWPVENTWTETINPFTHLETTRESKHNRYWIDPTILMAAQRYSREQEWIVLGIYHSHPEHPAVPSSQDLELAWIDYSYPILSVINGKVTTITSWRLDEVGQFQIEEMRRTDHFETLIDP